MEPDVSIGFGHKVTRSSSLERQLAVMQQAPGSSAFLLLQALPPSHINSNTCSNRQLRLRYALWVKFQEKLSVIPWSLLDVAPVPGGSGELRLMQRGTEFSIRLGHNELMNSRHSGSEEALGTIACERIKARNRPQILIGGLGMGFTLRAALAVLGPEARIVVAELVPAVLAWARVRWWRSLVQA
jgi:hypothetical protein